MKLRSTRHSEEVVSLREAVFRGLAHDGGLYLPEDIPSLSEKALAELKKSESLAQAGELMARAFLGDEWAEADVKRLVRAALSFDAPLVQVDDQVHLLELFHGPTLSFKDVGAQFMAALMKFWLAGERQRVTILTATSGDTGSAVAQAFHNVDGVRVVLLYPSGKVSAVQEQQFATLGGNVTAVEVAGRFDDCQQLVKEAFSDRQLREDVGLTSANSINIARLLPQMFYYGYAWAQLGGDIPPLFVVPSGNFGNLTAGMLAHLSGIPVRRFVAATNENDVVPSYLASGEYKPRPSVETHSNAMDVGSPSNFERLLSLFDDDHAQLSRFIAGYSCTDAETLITMRQVERDTCMLIDPHTAVGMFAARKYRQDYGAGSPLIVLSTAHPAKFPDVVEQAVGRLPDVPERLKRYLERTRESVQMDAEMPALRKILRDE